MSSPAPTPNAASGTVKGPTAQVAQTEAPKDGPPSELGEVQNALTMAFTAAEWKALKELRTKLPEILGKAYDNKKGAATTSIVLWGVRIDPTCPGKDAKVSVILMKFLRARKLNVRSARDLLVATLRWRDEFGVEAACKEQFPKDPFDKIGHLYGHDRQGRPVVYRAHGVNGDQTVVYSDPGRFVRWRVALMERAILALNFETVDQILEVNDWGGVNMRATQDANTENATSEANTIFKSHYPGLVYQSFYINIPKRFALLHWAFSKALPTSSIAKMGVASSRTSSITGVLLPYIDEDQLPRQYGGAGDGF